MDRSRDLAKATRSYLIAPAGCGKTHLIAEAIAKHGSARELILTHTHAGVAALRKKLNDLGAQSAQFHVATIAGWALSYARSFPNTSGLSSTTPTGKDWTGVYSAAGELLGRSSVKEIVRASYGGMYVDEYQDCTVEQHQLILQLADILPVEAR